MLNCRRRLDHQRPGRPGGGGERIRGRQRQPSGQHHQRRRLQRPGDRGPRRRTAPAARRSILEVMSQDLGNTAAGFSQNFAYNTLELTNGTYVELVDDAANSPGDAPEALYVNDLIVPAGTTLNLNGLNLYIHTEQIEGTIIGRCDHHRRGLRRRQRQRIVQLAATRASRAGRSSSRTPRPTPPIPRPPTATAIMPSPASRPARIRSPKSLQSGFAQTQPASPGTYTLTVASGQIVTGEEFGDHPTRVDQRRRVQRSQRRRHARERRAGPRAAGPSTCSTARTQVIATATTASGGTYSFTSLLPGTYTVQVVSQSGLRRLVLDQRDDHRRQRPGRHGELRRIRAGHDQRRGVRRSDG